MDHISIDLLKSTVESISAALDVSLDAWRHHLQIIRNAIPSIRFSETFPDGAHKEWQLFVIATFQRAAYASTDNGESEILDIADWCLEQSLALLQLYPEDISLLSIIGENWLLRAQKHILNIHHAEGSPVSSDGSQEQMGTSSLEAQRRLDTADYVEARALLLPAVEHLKRAVDVAHTQDMINGTLLAKTAETCMCLGNVSSIKVNGAYFRDALVYLQEASNIPDYTLSDHFQQYLDEYGPVVLG